LIRANSALTIQTTSAFYRLHFLTLKQHC